MYCFQQAKHPQVELVVASGILRVEDEQRLHRVIAWCSKGLPREGSGNGIFSFGVQDSKIPPLPPPSPHKK